MNDAIEQLVNIVENVTTETIDYRQSRACVVAQAISNNLIVGATPDFDDLMGNNKANINKVISAVNESVPIDTKLCQQLVRQLVAVRHRLVYGVISADLIKFVMKNNEVTNNVDPAAVTALDVIVNSEEHADNFIKASNALHQFFPEGGDND